MKSLIVQVTTPSDIDESEVATPQNQGQNANKRKWALRARSKGKGTAGDLKLLINGGPWERKWINRRQTKVVGCPLNQGETVYFAPDQNNALRDRPHKNMGAS